MRTLSHRFHRPILVVAAVFQLSFGAVELCHAANRYVSKAPGASDSNPGTLASPWLTLGKAAATANPGDVVFVRGGTYPEAVPFTRSGTGPAARITFRAYPSETPIVEGNAIDPNSLTENSLFLLEDVDWVTIDGFEIRNLRTSSKNVTPKAIFVVGACEGIEILNCRIHDIENNSTTANGNAHGIAAYGWSTTPISNLRIEGNELYDLVLGASEAMVLNGNVNGFEVLENTVHDCNNIGIDFIGYEGTGPTAALDRARNGVCRDNLVYNIETAFNPAYGGNFSTGGGAQSAAGIYVDGGVDIVIEQNTVYDCNIGIELASEHAGRWTERIDVRSNVIFRNDIGGLFLGGYNGSVGGTRNCVIRHNSFYQNDVNQDWNGEIYFQFKTENNVVTHNILFANSNGLFIGNPATSNTGNTVDWNVFHAPPASPIKWQWKNLYYYDLSSYRSATGNDGNSLMANPLYVSAGAGNLRLQSGSPAIDSGDPAFTASADERDRDGNLRVFSSAVDRGAFEFGSRASLPVIEVQFTDASAAIETGDTTPGAGDGTDFGYQLEGGGTVVKTLTIRNEGDEALTITNLNIGGTGSGDFAFGPLPAPILAGQSADVSLTFTPSAVAVRSATISILSNADIANFTFAIKGVGVTTNGGSGGIPELPEVPNEAPTSTPVPFDSAASGVFTGPIFDRNSGNLLGRFASLRLNRSGAFSATVFFEDFRAVLRGSLASGNPVVGVINDANGDPVTFSLTLGAADTDPASHRITVTFDGSGLMADATLVRSDFHVRLNPSPWAGRYTLLLPPPETPVANEPEGTGWATISVSKSGSIRSIGQLGDATNFSTNGFVASNGDWFLHSLLYRGTPRGQIGGWLRFRAIPGVSDLNGDLKWTKLADSRERRFPQGFVRDQPAIGSIFQSPARGSRTLTELADQLRNARLSLIETNLPHGGVEPVINWLANDRITYHGPETLRASVNRTTGRLAGRYVDRDSGLSLPFGGVVFQRQGIAGGCVTTSEGAGYLLVEPGISFPYPGSETRAAPPVAPTKPASSATGPSRTNALPDTDSAGSFSGLLTDGNTVPGSISGLRLAANGSFSGVVWFQGQRLALRGALDSLTGAFSGQISRRNASPVSVNLQLKRAVPGPQVLDAFFLSGMLSADATTATVNLHRSAFNPRSAPVPETDRVTYTALMPAGSGRTATEPQGDGYALVAIVSSGRVRISGRLGDGTAFSSATTLHANGEIPLFVPLYRTTPSGYLAGELRLRDVSSISDFDGTLHWLKGTNLRDHRYPDGFELDQPLVGSKFARALPGQRSIDGFDDEYHNGWIRWEGASRQTAGAVDQVISWLPNDRVAFFGPEQLAIRINRRNGMISGKYNDRAGFQNVFSGVIFAKQSLAQGVFLESNAAGRFRIDPR
ncbi:MAG: choice-of-anchor D domain-containing protein [Verrucomicrobiae bacterium]|nr:choice-of-anchor D domain-containing protein [Verrucomicrobiae bacterium]